MSKPQKTAQGTWRIQFEVKGQREAGTFKTARDATAWATQRKAELLANAPGSLTNTYTLGDAFQKFAEEESPKRRGERWEIVRLAAFAKPVHGLPVKKPITKLSIDDLKAWRDRRLADTSRGTVLRDITLLSAVLEAARTEWRWIAVNPMRELKKPSMPAHRERTIAPHEIRSMLRVLGYTGKPVRSVSQAVAVCFLLALATGMRAGEVCGLLWADVKATYCTVHNVKSIKLGVSRDVPFSPVAQKLVGMMRGWDSPLVFGFSAATLDSLFRRARGRAGLEGFTFHDARHT
ncbi:MAG: tyrosine-type recombinase/integrase, partial [Polaromonas sp.]